MEERKIPKKEIRRDARQLLKEGIPKQQAFETLVDKYKYAKDVADVIRVIPSLTRVKKYGIWNNILLGLLIVIALLVLFYGRFPFGILWYALLIYGVATKTMKYYGWITLLGALGTIFTIIASIAAKMPVNIISMILLVFVFLPTCILPIWLEKKLCPEPTERKELYTNVNGEQRMRIVYEFNDEIISG